MELQSYFEPPTFKNFAPSQQLPAASYQIKKKKKAEKGWGNKRGLAVNTVITHCAPKEMTSGINDPCDWLPRITGCQFVFWRHLLCIAKDWCEKLHAVPRLNKCRFVFNLEKRERNRERKGKREKTCHRWKHVLRGHARVSLPQHILWLNFITK